MDDFINGFFIAVGNNHISANTKYDGLIDFPYTWEMIQNQLQNLNEKYTRPLEGWSPELTTYSPLEADRNSYIWDTSSGWYLDNYKNIRETLPSFNMIFWHIFLTSRSIPLFTDYVRAYLLTYCESNKLNPDISKYFYDKTEHGFDTIGRTFTIGSETFTNRLIQFKNGVSHNLPFNKLTTEQIIGRLYKVYPSLVRDLYHPLIFGTHGAQAWYSLSMDYKGIDLLINHIPCFSYTNTNAAKRFAQDKQHIRHPYILDGKSVAIQLLTTPNSNGIILPTEEVVNLIISDIQNNTIKDSYIY